MMALDLFNLFEEGFNFIRKTLAHTLSGRMTLVEWGESAAQATDIIISKITAQEDLRYIGGYLKFRQSPDKTDVIDMMFEIYFLDSYGEWHVSKNSTEIMTISLKEEDLAEIRQSPEGIRYELHEPAENKQIE